MARQTNRLNARSVLSLAAQGRHSDGGGLYLVVDHNGAKRWSFLFRWLGKHKPSSATFIKLEATGALLKMEINHMEQTKSEPLHLRTAKRCGAKRRNGMPCRSPAVNGKARCRIHGGAAGVGAPREVSATADISMGSLHVRRTRSEGQRGY